MLHGGETSSGDGFTTQAACFTPWSSYLIFLLAAKVRRIEGLDFDAFLIGRPQPGVTP